MKIGLLGAGKIGQLRARTIHEHPGSQLVAVCDVDASRAQAAAKGGKVCRNVEELLDVPMDALVVSTPVHVHDDPCVAALGRGMHVLVEKPVANTIEGTRRIVDAAIAARRVLAVGFNLRYYPAMRLVHDVVANGDIGTPDHVRVFGGHEGLPKFAYDWEYKAPTSGGGAMWDVGIHMTDLTRYVMGDVTEVFGVATGTVWNVPGSEDNALAVLRSPAGLTAAYHATWTEWKGYHIHLEVYGDKGMVRGAYAPMESLLITQDRPGGPRRVDRRRYLDVQVREKVWSWQTTALQSFREELQDFHALIEGRAKVRIADGHDGLRAAEVAAAVAESTRTGQAVRLPALGRMPR